MYKQITIAPPSCLDPVFTLYTPLIRPTTIRLYRITFLFQVRHGRDAFLLLVSDGITHVLNNQEIVDIACTCQTPKEATNHVCDQALHYGTEDNCTALVVPFGAWGKYANTKKIHFSFGRNTIGERYM